MRYIEIIKENSEVQTDGFETFVQVCVDELLPLLKPSASFQFRDIGTIRVNRTTDGKKVSFSFTSEPSSEKNGQSTWIDVNGTISNFADVSRKFAEKVGKYFAKRAKLKPARKEFVPVEHNPVADFFKHQDKVDKSFNR